MSEVQDSATLITATIGIATLWITYRQSQIEKSKTRRELFDRFNLRFDRMNEDLNAVCEDREPTEGKSAQNVIQDYPNLCAEEYLAASEGLVSKRVWTAWMAGMNYYTDYPLVAEAFRREKKRAPHSYYGLFDKLELPAERSKIVVSIAR